jgi:hypothetical protein
MTNGGKQQHPRTPPKVPAEANAVGNRYYS